MDGRPSYDELRRVMLGDGTGIAMTDATAGALEQLFAKKPDAAPPMALKMSTTCLECPSVLITLALLTKGSADPTGIDYSYSGRPSADPSQPIAREGAALWRAGDPLPVQAVAAPPSRVIEAIAKVALAPLPAMSVLRARAGAIEASPAELLAAMVHSRCPRPVSRLRPMCSAGSESARWRSAAPRGDGWLTSSRREALRSLVLGPADWTCAAALLALTEVLLDEPEALPDARDWLEVLVRSAPDVGHCPWASALAHLFAKVPGLRPNLLANLSVWLSERAQS